MRKFYYILHSSQFVRTKYKSKAQFEWTLGYIDDQSIEAYMSEGNINYTQTGVKGYLTPVYKSEGVKI